MGRNDTSAQPFLRDPALGEQLAAAVLPHPGCSVYWHHKADIQTYRETNTMGKAVSHPNEMECKRELYHINKVIA